MVIERALLDAHPDEDDEFVLSAVCNVCGERCCLAPDQSIVAQMRTFLDVHRHQD